MDRSPRVRKSIASGAHPGGGPHWASKCKLSQGREFASKLEPVRIGNDVSHKQEIQDLEDYLGMAHGGSEAPGTTTAFAFFAAGAGSILGCKSQEAQEEDNEAEQMRQARFVMKLKGQSRPRTATEDLDASNEEELPRSEFPASDDSSSIPAGSWLPLPGAFPTSTPPTPCTSARTPQQVMPAISIAECQSCSAKLPAHAPVPTSLRDLPRGMLHDPVTMQELHQAHAPVPISLRDLRPTVQRRAPLVSESEESSGSHYEYFRRRLPHEHPQHRAAMQRKCAHERQGRPGNSQVSSLASETVSPRPIPRRSCFDSSPPTISRERISQTVRADALSLPRAQSASTSNANSLPSVIKPYSKDRAFARTH